MFNIPNPLGLDMTTTGWSPDFVWKTLFPPLTGSQHTGFGKGLALTNAVQVFR